MYAALAEYIGHVCACFVNSLSKWTLSVWHTLSVQLIGIVFTQALPVHGRNARGSFYFMKPAGFPAG
ncbi:UNVERIFIED_CONTAM: hypothetical protein FKN15_017228 [Acipenser sinensis]